MAPVLGRALVGVMDRPGDLTTMLVRLFGRSHSVELGDALIAATAEHHDLKLATLNVRHFPMFKRLKPAY